MSSVNNKKIIQNTVFLYIRMIVVMLISLYTVRAILHRLGVEDYGIYNVIGGVVSMFTFLNGSLATSSQRYFSIELAKGDIKSLNKQFSQNLTIFGLILFVIVLFLETIGIWFVNTKMIIPTERIFAANIVYQVSIVSFALNMLAVPYNALIVAYEKMSAFAYISVIEAILKLSVVFCLDIFPFDRLIVYGILIAVVSLYITASYMLYCKKNLKGAEYHFNWNTAEVISLFSFTGWHIIGTLSNIIRSQGINLLINVFFNPVVNAARAIAFNVNVAVNQLSNNFFIAVKPQMYKCYAANDMAALHRLIMFSTWMCCFLVIVVSLPFIFNAELILRIWLKDVPEYAVLFTCLVLINGIIDSTSGSTICPILATGKIKKFYLISGTLIIMNLPISYVFLRIGYPAAVTMVVSIIISFIAVIIRAYFVKLQIGLPFGEYLKLILKVVISSLCSSFVLYVIKLQMNNQIVYLFASIILNIIILAILFYFMVLSKTDRQQMFGYLKKVIRK